MTKPSDYGLSYAAWRPGQLEAISKVITSSERFVLIEAPPGSGKSGIARALASVYPSPTTILTHTKDLQRQYRDTFDMPVLMGRSNFTCTIDPPATADYGICTIGIPCGYAGPEGQPGCPYFDQIRDYGWAPLVTANYAFHLSLPLRYTGLLIADEAHTAPAVLRSQNAVSLSLADLAVMKLTPPDGSVLDLRDWARDNLPAIRSYLEQHTEERLPLSVYRLVRLAREMEKLLGMSDDALTRSTDISLDVTPISVTRYAPDLWRKCDKVVLMTATPGDPTVLLTQLGIPLGECLVLRVPSSFPKRRRPIYYWPVARVKGNGDGWPEVTDAVDQILEKHEGQRGLIHTVSYRLAQYLKQRSRHSHRIIAPTASQRERAIREFRGLPSGSSLVLASPAVGQGLDLPYDLCRFQIMPKLPFPDASDPVVKALGREAQYSQVAIALTQAYGRIMRAADDSGVSYLLDGNWQWFLPAARSAIPVYFKEAVIRWSP